MIDHAGVQVGDFKKSRTFHTQAPRRMSVRVCHAEMAVQENP